MTDFYWEAISKIHNTAKRPCQPNICSWQQMCQSVQKKSSTGTNFILSAKQLFLTANMPVCPKSDSCHHISQSNNYFQQQICQSVQNATLAPILLCLKSYIGINISPPANSSPQQIHQFAPKTTHPPVYIRLTSKTHESMADAPAVKKCEIVSSPAVIAPAPVSFPSSQLLTCCKSSD